MTAGVVSAFSDFVETLPSGDIGLAVSGGGDSIALLIVAAQWARKSDRVIKAVTLDHGLREGSANEAEFVEDLCAELGVPHQTLRWGGVFSGNLQDAARRARQDLIADWARREDVVAVATGHTRDDQAETFMLRLKRGSGVDGLAGMAAYVKKDDCLWVRPLLELRREDLRTFLTDHDVKWVEDPSNSDERFDRVKIRNAMEVLDELGLSVDVLADTTARMQRARASLEAVTLKVAKDIAAPRLIGSVRLSVDGLKEQSEEIQFRLLAHTLRWVSGADYRPRLKALKKALAAILSGKPWTLGGCILAPSVNGSYEVCREVNAVESSDASHGIFDGRWVCDVAKGEWRALGDVGIAERPEWRDTAECRNAILSSPSLWYNNELQAVPFMDKPVAVACRLINGPESFFSSIMTH